MSKLTIAGYEQEGNCEHCGRKLKHCIKIEENGVQRIVGATCFAKKMTQEINGLPALFFLNINKILNV